MLDGMFKVDKVQVSLKDIKTYFIKWWEALDACSEIPSSQQQLQDFSQLDALFLIFTCLHLYHSKDTSEPSDIYLWVFSPGPFQCSKWSQIDDSAYFVHMGTQQINSNPSKVTHKRIIIRPYSEVIRVWFLCGPLGLCIVKTKCSQSTSNFAL